MQDEDLRVPEEQYPWQWLVYPEVWKQDNKDCETSNRTYISHIYNKVYPSCLIHRASEDTPYSFYLLHPQTFPIIPCFFQKKSVSLQKKDYL